jgi:hypothetical protein
MAEALRLRHLRERELAIRLMNALDQKMTAFEKRLTESDASAADSERDARTLNTLVRLFDRLKTVDVKSLRRTPATTVPIPDAKDAIDADRLRRELARRLARLRASHGG